MSIDGHNQEINPREFEKLLETNRELSEQLDRGRQKSRRDQDLIMLFQKAHQLCGQNLSIRILGERFLQLLAAIVKCEGAAFLRYDEKSGAFCVEFALNFPKDMHPVLTPSIAPSEFIVVERETASDPLVDSLRNLADAPVLLWMFSMEFKAALLLSRGGQADKIPDPFDDSQREMVGEALQIISDIYEQSRARANLEKTQERFELVIRGAELGMFDWNVATGEVFFDTQWKKMLGYAEEEIEHNYKSWEDLVNPEDLDNVLQILKDHLEGHNEDYEIEHRLRTRDGSWKWILARGKVVERDENDRPLRMAGTHLDIDARKRAEEDLLKFKTVADRANYGTAIVDLKGNFLYVNEQFAEMHNYTPEELYGKNLDVFHDRSQMERVEELNLQLQKVGEYSSEEVWHVDRHGNPFPTLMNGVLIRDKEGNPSYMAATAVDITDRIEAQGALNRTLERLERSHDDMRSILNELALGTALFDKSGCVTFLSRAGEKLTGLEQATIKGRRWEEVFPFSRRQVVQLKEMIARPTAERKRISITRKSRGGMPVRMDIEVKDDPREPDSRILFFYDTSELHDLRQLLNEKTKYQNLIGKSKSMQTVFEQIKQLCKVDTTVLIEGDTGTGKELVSRALHSASLRKDKPFIAVNCSGLTESVLHSQLFGHKRGAFTGAVQDHRGVFEEGDKGTVFLDEIAGISPSVQASLLRVIDEKEITPLGESKPRKVDVRIIVASNQDMREEVDQGRFRADLFYRIRVARINLSPLCQRREDIPLLAYAFLRQSKASSGKAVEDFTNDAMKRLREYDWPGNVRELKNAIEFAALQTTQSVIRSADLPPEILEGNHAYSPEIRGRGNDREALIAALRETRGNRTAAARRLGISRATFYRRLAELNIEI